MADDEFEEIAADVYDLLSEVGVVIRISDAKPTGGSYDAATDSYVGGSAAAYSDALAINDVQGGGAQRALTVTASDETQVTTAFWISALGLDGEHIAVTPAPGRLLLWGGRQYRCRSAREYAPGGIPILFFALAER